MFTIITSLLGFLSSGLPNLLSYFQDVKDKQHELDMMDRQIEFQKLNLGAQVQAVDINAQEAQLQSLYANQKTGIAWIDAYNGIVRPTIALSFLLIFIFVKAPLIYTQFKVWEHGYIVHGLWTETDGAIMGAIIGFFFGGRHFYKSSGK